jgi:adenylate kinase family enzyme
MSWPQVPNARVVVVGTSCAGKSTFAQSLAAARGCAFIELDDLHWSPDWTPRPPAAFLQSVEAAAAGSRRCVLRGGTRT